jgi:hypothetical protein
MMSPPLTRADWPVNGDPYYFSKVMTIIDNELHAVHERSYAQKQEDVAAEAAYRADAHFRTTSASENCKWCKPSHGHSL